MARMCGLDEIVNVDNVTNTLKAIHKYNLKRDLSELANPQRPGFALGREGGFFYARSPREMIFSFPSYTVTRCGQESNIKSRLISCLRVWSKREFRLSG